MKSLLIAATAALALSLTATAQAAPTTPPLSPTERFFECTTALPVGNFLDEEFSWSETKPAKSAKDGAGCAWLDPFLSGLNQPNGLYDAIYGGAYAGEVSRIDLTLYGNHNPTLRSKTIRVALIVDGERTDLTGLTAQAEPGPLPFMSKFTFTLPDLEIPATKDDKQIILGVQGSFADDGDGWYHGASEVPAGVKLFDSDDVAVEEEEDPTTGF